MVGGQDTANTASHETDQEIAEVHLEACLAFVGEGGASDGICLVCGYRGDEHDDLFEFLAAPKVVAA